MDKDLEIQTYKALMLFIAMAKAQNEEYTRFLGMFRHRDKQLFNELIRASEKFSKSVYESMTTDTKETVDEIQEMMHNFIHQVIETAEFKVLDKPKNLKP